MRSAAAVIDDAARAALAPVEAPGCAAWAEAKLVLPAAASARPGPLDLSLAPYLYGILRSCDDPLCEQVTIWKSSQVGLTLGLFAYALYAGQVLGRSQIFAYPTEAKGKKLNVEKLHPMVRESPAVAAALSGRAWDLTKDLIDFSNGAKISFAWSNSTTGLKGDSVPIVFLDEYDEHVEGSLDRARSRCKTFEGTRKIVLPSTPVDEGYGSHVEYARGDRRRLLVPCPHTGRYFELWDFSLIRWDGGLKADPEEVRRSAWIQSPFSPRLPTGEEDPAQARSYRIYERHKPWMLRHALWVRDGEEVESDGSILATLDEDGSGAGVGLSVVDEALLREGAGAGVGRIRRHPRALPRGASEEHRRLVERLGVRIVGEPVRPGALHHSYRINALASRFETWGGIAAGFVAAGGEPSADWWRENLAQPRRVKGERIEIDSLRRLRKPETEGGYRMRTVPDGVVALVGVFDVQADYAWDLVVGFGDRGRDRWLIDAGRRDTAPGGDLVELDELLGRTYERRGGGGLRVPVAAWGIDHGHRAKEVERAWLRWRRAGKAVQMVKGDGTLDRTWGVRPGQTRSGFPLLLVNVNFGKDHLVDIVLGRSGLESLAVGGEEGGDEGLPRPGRMHFPEDCPDVVFEHMAAEHRRPAVVSRRRTWAWELRPGRTRNDYFDLLVYSWGLAESLGAESLTRAGVERAKAALAGGGRAAAESAEEGGGESGGGGGGRTGAARFRGGPQIARRFRR